MSWNQELLIGLLFGFIAGQLAMMALCRLVLRKHTVESVAREIVRELDMQKAEAEEAIRIDRGGMNG